MLRSLNAVLGYSVHEQDGDFGRVYDFFIEDTTWAARYLVVECGGWLDRRRVLISPVALGHPDWEKRIFPVNLTREQVRQSPDVDTAKPVYRQHEVAMNAYYGWPHYWTLEPILVAPTIVSDEPEPGTEGDPHLRSLRELSGYRVTCQDQEVGHIEDLIADEDAWAVRYLVMKAGHPLHGKRLLLAPEWIQQISWARKEVVPTVTLQFIRNCPEFDPSQPVNREFELRLYDFYGRPHDPQ